MEISIDSIGLMPDDFQKIFYKYLKVYLMSVLHCCIKVW